ncbi:hypothetical protein L208DRAFT_1383144 [Tricholoma matsutake]|nr:hypothetical protein L208DRAFT_1383144 [Tricholoma matsutake 945]
MEAESLKKKRVGHTPTIPISIIISDDYMHTLRAHQKKKGKRSTSNNQASSSRSLKQKMQPVLLNLDEDDNDNEDEDDNEDGDLLECEKKHLAALDKKLTGCQRCGQDRFCKIDKSGNHVNLSMGQC